MVFSQEAHEMGQSRKEQGAGSRDGLVSAGKTVRTDTASPADPVKKPAKCFDFISTRWRAVARQDGSAAFKKAISRFVNPDARVDHRLFHK